MDTKSQGIFFGVPGKRTIDMMLMLYNKQEDGTVVGHGLEIPVVYIFAGCAKDTMKLKKLRKASDNSVMF